MTMNTLGLYIHIPFCKSKCRYCDFCSFPHPREELIDAYLAELNREIREMAHTVRQQKNSIPLSVDTVYFGGGTPTLLSPSQWEGLLTAVFDSFPISDHAEITAECNPATADLGTFRALRTMGINRLSIGVQSMHDHELKRLGRLHRAADVVQTFSDARLAGFENISADIMFGIPEGTRESLSQTLRAVCDLAPEHMSVYGLQIEEGTYFARHLDELPLPDEETERAMYMDSVALLSEHGLSRYEISNFSLPGYQSRHNLKYWHRRDYLGLGLAAHSCIGNRRFSNTEDISAYLSGQKIKTDQQISPHDILCETVMLGMRLDEGVDFSSLTHMYGRQATELYDALTQYITGGFVTEHEGRLAFTTEGMYVSNTILGNVLEFDD